MIAGFIRHILARLHLHPGPDEGEDDALRDMERRLAALDTKVAVRERIDRERLRRGEGWHRGH